MPTGADGLTAEMDRLTAEVDRLQEWVTELRQDRHYLRTMLSGAIASNAKRIEAPGPRWWRWPWQRGE